MAFPRLAAHPYAWFVRAMPYRGTYRWTPALAVGVEAIDEQHRELFARAERLIDALRGGHRDAVMPLVLSLDDCVARHFAAEERLMRDAGYPALERHAAEHRSFRAQYAARASALDRSGPTALTALEIHNWLSDWLRSHVGGEDRALAAFLSPGGS